MAVIATIFLGSFTSCDKKTSKTSDTIEDSTATNKVDSTSTPTVADTLTTSKVESTDENSIEGTWKINKIGGNTVENDLTKTFTNDGTITSKVNGVTKKSSWKIENGKLCLDETGKGFVCSEYKIAENTLTYTIEGMELSYKRQ